MYIHCISVCTCTCTSSVQLLETHLFLIAEQHDNVFMRGQRADHVDLSLERFELRRARKHLHSHTLSIRLVVERRGKEGKEKLEVGKGRIKREEEKIGATDQEGSERTNRVDRDVTICQTCIYMYMCTSTLKHPPCCILHTQCQWHHSLACLWCSTRSCASYIPSGRGADEP